MDEEDTEVQDLREALFYYFQAENVEADYSKLSDTPLAELG